MADDKSQGLMDPAAAAESEPEVEVSQEGRLYDRFGDPDVMVNIYNPDLDEGDHTVAITTVPAHAFESMWKARGWVQYHPEDPNDQPWAAKAAPAAEASGGEEDAGADDTKDGASESDAAPAASKEK